MPWVGDSHNTLNPLDVPRSVEEAAAFTVRVVGLRLIPGVERRPEREAARLTVLEVLGLLPRQVAPEPEPAPAVVPPQRVKPRRVRPGRRWCSMHAASHPVAAFGRDANNADGLASSCREARSAAQRRQRVDARRAEQ